MIQMRARTSEGVFVACATNESRRRYVTYDSDTMSFYCIFY